MAIARKGKAPAKGTAKKATGAAPKNDDAVGLAVMAATAKLTVSIKRRLANGDEVFIAPGIEIGCAADDLEAKQAEVTERVHNWMDELLAQYPDSDPLEDDEDDEDDEEDEEDEEDEDDEEDEEGDDEVPSPEEINKMKKADLVALASDYDIELEGTKVADIREELIDAFYDEEEADEEEDDDEAGDDDEGFEEADLKAMKLDELQEICDEWEIDHPSIKKGAKLAAKKAAYVEHILEAQEEE